MVISRSGNTAYLTEIWNGTESISSDVAKEKGGSGKYFRPHDLTRSCLCFLFKYYPQESS